MAILKPDKAATLGSVTVNEYLFTKHNPNRIIMPSTSMEGKIIGVTIHNTLWITTTPGTTPAEQYTRATVNGNESHCQWEYERCPSSLLCRQHLYMAESSAYSEWLVRR